MLAQVTPVAKMEDLIYERTGAKPGTFGGFFSLNPRVDDIPERFSISHRGIRFLRLGTIESGGSGCICPESAMLRALVTHLLLYNDQMLILDMEAGVEHLGRATAQAVDAFITVLEPGRRSINTAEHVQKLAADIGIRRVTKRPCRQGETSMAVDQFLQASICSNGTRRIPYTNLADTWAEVKEFACPLAPMRGKSASR